jgi:hypothetical protein
MASRTPTKQQQGRQQQTAAAAFAGPLNSKDRRHSVNAPPLHGEPSTVALRQEQSSPAVISGAAGNGSLIKQVVSASGQGCAAVVVGNEGAPSARSGVMIWRTRSVRSKAESYCILHLKGASQRGVTVQVGCCLDRRCSQQQLCPHTSTPRQHICISKAPAACRTHTTHCFPAAGVLPQCCIHATRHQAAARAHPGQCLQAPACTPGHLSTGRRQAAAAQPGSQLQRACHALPQGRAVGAGS